ncbi:unnamed protein product [Protopolystoma xenopodis]|uniref:Uncharacterized protein n=1 Tax=Protopolystoma xenopodis TaxID=117903 RepID=A0A3S4ZVK5_9PLAT|nr:unnamed protein product [Protopolystoma xenopodis]
MWVSGSYDICRRLTEILAQSSSHQGKAILLRYDHTYYCDPNFFYLPSSLGRLRTDGNPILATLWGKKSAGPFNFMHSGYGLGGALAPLLLTPFTQFTNSSKNSDSDVVTTAANNYTASVRA